VLDDKQARAYFVLVALIICGLAVSAVTATKVVHFWVDFPFSNIVFSIFTYPMVGCICEIWGKKVAKQTVWLVLACQFIVVLLLQLSIIAPHASFWTLQHEYETILSTGNRVVVAGLLAFLVSQMLDVTVYQKIKNASKGKRLWLRYNVSTIVGQFVDSGIFISIVFYASHHKFNMFMASILVKIVLSILMTPVVYLIVMTINRSLHPRGLKVSRPESSLLQ